MSVVLLYINRGTALGAVSRPIKNAKEVSVKRRRRLLVWMYRTRSDGDLVLMDAGGELCDYVSDITRTWPANGKFSEPQAEVYDALLDVQVKVIEVWAIGTKLYAKASRGVRQSIYHLIRHGWLL